MHPGCGFIAATKPPYIDQPGAAWAGGLGVSPSLSQPEVMPARRYARRKEASIKRRFS